MPKTMRQCAYQFLDKTRCPELVWVEYGLCLFHYKRDNKAPTEFLKRLKEKIEKKDFRFEGYYFPASLPEINFSHLTKEIINADFRKTTFACSAFFNEITFSGRGIYFNDAQFSGKVTSFGWAVFSGGEAYFDDAQFSGSRVSFQGAKFYGDRTSFQGIRFDCGMVCFRGAEFGSFREGELYGSVSFANSHFLGEETDFVEARFSGASFDGSRFSSNKRTDFYRAEFQGPTSFSETEFSGGQTTFREALFKGNVIFKATRFTGEEISFSDTQFIKEGEVDFDNPRFDSQGYFIRTRFEKVCRFRWSEFSRTLLKQVVFQDTDLRNVKFLYSNIDRVSFNKCTFNEGIPDEFFDRPFLKRKSVLADELVLDEEIKEGREREEYKHVESLYRQLKKNFEERRDWETAGDFHYGEMECRRKALPRWWIVPDWFRRNFGLIAWYKYASGYGEWPFVAFINLLLFVLLVFPLFYLFSEHDPFWTCVWDSVKVATLMKIGNPIEPDSPYGKFFLASEYILGPLLIALLALSLRRKLKR